MGTLAEAIRTTVGTPITDALTYARAQIGDWYKWGAEGPNLFDCSGLVQAAYEAAGVKLPRTSQAQYDATTKVSDPQPGDLVFFGSSARTIHHVGLYIGGGKMIDAPHSGARVGVHEVYGNVVGYTRPLAGQDLDYDDPGSGGGGSGGGANVDTTSTAGDVVKTLTGAFSPFRLLSGDWSEDVARLAMTGVFVVGGIALVVLGFWRGVAPARASRGAAA